MRFPPELTTMAQVRRSFWEAHPDLPRKMIRSYNGKGRMFPTDTRVAFVEYVDMLCRDGRISTELANRVTLASGESC